MCGAEGEANAQMPCGHVISKEGMTGFLRSLISAKQFVIKCPGFNPNQIQNYNQKKVLNSTNVDI